MWRLRLAAVFVAVCAAFPAWAGDQTANEVVVSVDKSSQEMSVAVDGHTRYVWPVSTGRVGYRTPNGHFHPEWMARIHYSKKYDDSPMPHSIFFHRGFAIHGTEYTGRLGRPASHGCVRLLPRNAATLFSLVRKAGMDNTRIVITGSIAANRRAQRRADIRRWRARAERD